MKVRSTLTLGITLCVATMAACDSPTDPANPQIKGLGVDAHELQTTCVTGATKLVISVYPQTIAVGGHATPYASVFDASGVAVSSLGVTWTIQDTTIVHVTGIDANLRPILTGRRSGTTNIVGWCGSLTTAKPLTVSGTSTSSANTMSVTFSVQSLPVGQTTQAAARETNSSGSAVSMGTVTWTSSNTTIATVSSTGLVTGKSAGTATITAKTSTATGSGSITIGSSTSVASPSLAVSGLTAAAPATPQTTPAYGALPAVSRVVRVAAGGDLQGALNRALPGDAILLAPGARFTGTFVLRNKNLASPCSAWITVRTDAAPPALGQRTTPTTAAGFAKLVTTSVAPALRTEPKASCYRLSGLEISLPVISSYNYGLVTLGDGGNVAQGDAQVTTDLAPRNLVLDHLYVHGASGSNFKRCISLNSASTVIADSWISECHANGYDSQAIAGWNGPGPYLIQNNHLAAAGENIMFGGADPRILNLVPSDITIRGNHFYKNPAWKGVWTIKNLFELKSARRLLIENNVFENNWIAAQTGMAIIFKSVNEGGTAPWQGTTDVTFRYNIVRNSPQGMLIAARSEANPVVPLARVRVENNLFANIGTFNGTSYGRMLIFLEPLHDVTIAHNTMIHNYNGGQMVISDASNGAARNIVLRDNVATKGGPYGAVMHSGVRIGTASLIAFASSSWSFDRNVVIGLDPEYVPWHPQSSYYAPTISSVGFANASGGDYSLGSASPYRGKATDGRDPGADFPGLRQRTNSVIVP